MIDQSMVGWHFTGFVLVVTLAMIVAKRVLPNVQGFPRFVLFGLVVFGTWYAHTNYYIQSGPFLRDRVMVPFLGKRPPAERLAYTFETKLWKDPNIRQQIKNVAILQRSQKAIELANAGIFRVSEERQTRWLVLSGKLFEGAQEAECAGMIKGTMNVERIFRMLNRLSEPEIREYFEIVTDALAIGATPGLPTPPPVVDQAAAFQTIYNGLSLSEQTRFRAAAMTAQFGGGKDICWFGQTLFTRIAALPSATRTGLMQSLATGQAPSRPPTAPLQARQF